MRRPADDSDTLGGASMTGARRAETIFEVGGGGPAGARADAPAADAAESAVAAPASSLLLWVNGREVDPAAPHLSPLDRGFTLADGLFETMRAHDGAIFRLRAHLDRLRAGASALRIPLPDDLDATIAAALRRAAEAGHHDAAVRLTVSRGAGAHGVAQPEEPRPTIVLAVQPAPGFPRAIYAAGIAVAIASGRRNEHAMTAGLKTLAYTDMVMAMAEARARGAEDALFLDTEGHLSEGSSSNLFLVLGKALATPPLSCGALPGITRAAVLECARDLGLRVTERALVRRELRAAKEAFLTSSLRGIAPVTRVVGDIGEGYAVGDGVPGPVTRALMDAYAALVRRECPPRGSGAAT
ncbi:MAG TPA: aminotransferase class IV [Gemmatimonadaceae bacterium]|nr:aminotransferase class IV [Gemmatimonadaceae bacterium]